MNIMLQLLLREIVIQAPQLALELVRLFSKDNVTETDWDEARARWRNGYDKFIENAETKKDNK